MGSDGDKREKCLQHEVPAKGQTRTQILMKNSKTVIP